MSETCLKNGMFQDRRSSKRNSLSENVSEKPSCSVYSVIHINECNIDDEFDSEMRLKHVMLPFPSTQRNLATKHYAGAMTDMFAEAEVPLVASEMNPERPSVEAHR